MKRQRWTAVESICGKQMCSLCCKEVWKLSHHRPPMNEYQVLIHAFFFKFVVLTSTNKGINSFTSSYKHQSHHSFTTVSQFWNITTVLLSSPQLSEATQLLVRGLMTNASYESINTSIDPLVCSRLLRRTGFKSLETLQPASPSMFFWHGDVSTKHCVVEFSPWSVEISHQHVCYIGRNGDNLNREESSFPFELMCSKSSPEHPSSFPLHRPLQETPQPNKQKWNRNKLVVVFFVSLQIGGLFWVVSIVALHAHILPLLHHYRQATCRRWLDPPRLCCSALASPSFLSVMKLGINFLGTWQCSTIDSGVVAESEASC